MGFSQLSWENRIITAWKKQLTIQKEDENGNNIVKEKMQQTNIKLQKGTPK